MISSRAMQFSIYHPDGTYLTKVKGTQLYNTADGDKARLKLHPLAGVTTCTLDGRTLYEVRKNSPR